MSQTDLGYTSFSLEELSAAVVGAIGVHYELPESLGHIIGQGPETASRLCQESAQLISDLSLDLSLCVQLLRNREIEAGEETGALIALTDALAASLGACYWCMLHQGPRSAIGRGDQVVLSPEQIERMLNPGLQAFLSEHCPSQIMESYNLKKERAYEAWPQLQNSSQPGGLDYLLEPVSLEEIASASVGAIGLHYQLAEEVEVICALEESRQEELEELMALLAASSTSLGVKAQRLRNHPLEEQPELSRQWSGLLASLATSLNGACLYTGARAVGGEVGPGEMMLTPEQLEAELSDELNQLLEKQCVTELKEDLGEIRQRA